MPSPPHRHPASQPPLMATEAPVQPSLPQLLSPSCLGASTPRTRSPPRSGRGRWLVSGLWERGCLRAGPLPAAASLTEGEEAMGVLGLGTVGGFLETVGREELYKLDSVVQIPLPLRANSKWTVTGSRDMGLQRGTEVQGVRGLYAQGSMGTGFEALLFALGSPAMGQVGRPWVAEGAREGRRQLSGSQGPGPAPRCAPAPSAGASRYGSPRPGMLTERCQRGLRDTRLEDTHTNTCILPSTHSGPHTQSAAPKIPMQTLKRDDLETPSEMRYS